MVDINEKGEKERPGDELGWGDEGRHVSEGGLGRAGRPVESSSLYAPETRIGNPEALVEIDWNGI